MPTVRIQEKNYSESIMVLKLKDGHFFHLLFHFQFLNIYFLYVNISLP